MASTAAAASGNADVVFGAVVSGRNAPIPDIETIAGPTIATVPVRMRISYTQSVAEFLREVQDQATTMIAHEQAGIQHIQKASEDAQRACRFQALLVTQPPDDASLGGQDAIGVWEAGEDSRYFTNYVLNLNCFQGGNGGLTMLATFNTASLSEQQMALLLERFEGYLGQLAAATESQRLAELDALSSSDYKQLWSWNARVPDTSGKNVHSLVEGQVASRPNAIAVSAWDGDFSYGELNSLASRLATHLTSLGVGPEVIVPLCFEKSRWTTVAMLAVLKAGGAFTLLEPSQPTARIRSIIEQTQAKVMLCSSDEALKWSKTCVVKVFVTVSAKWFAKNQDIRGASHAMTNRINPGAAVYIVFTSGSTGTPKGVIVTHGAFSSAIAHQAGPMGYGTARRVFEFSSYAFDMSIETTFFSLATGACLCVPSDSARRSDLTRTIESMGVDYLKLTPSVARTIDRRSVPTVRTLVLGGEEIREDDLLGWGNQVRVIKTYGPAECSPVATIEPKNHPTGKDISIGHGAGATTWVVDSDNANRLAPVGAVGELYIEGPIVGRGYLNDNEKTAAAFIENPAWLSRGQRWPPRPPRPLVQDRRSGAIPRGWKWKPSLHRTERRPGQDSRPARRTRRG